MASLTDIEAIDNLDADLVAESDETQIILTDLDTHIVDTLTLTNTAIETSGENNVTALEGIGAVLTTESGETQTILTAISVTLEEIKDKVLDWIPTTIVPGSPISADLNVVSSLGGTFNGSDINKINFSGINFELSLNLNIGGNRVAGHIGISAGSLTLVCTLCNAYADVSVTIKEPNAKSNWVMWSKIGDVRFDIDLSNDAGYRPMDWKGWVLSIVQLDKNAIVYGTGGVSILYPVASPGATFGCKTLTDVGLLSKTAVVSVGDFHLFLNSNKDLCKIDIKNGYSIIGYRTALASLASTVSLIYDNKRERLYITDGTLLFVYSGQGLGTASGALTGILSNASTHDIYNANTATFQNISSFTTNIFDCESRVMKQLTKVAVVTDYTNPIFVQVAVRKSADSAWVWSKSYRCNHEGIASPSVTGVEFKIKVFTLVSSSQVFVIDKLWFRYKLCDKRHRFEYNPSAYYGKPQQANKSIDIGG